MVRAAACETKYTPLQFSYLRIVLLHEAHHQLGFRRFAASRRQPDSRIILVIPSFQVPAFGGLVSAGLVPRAGLLVIRYVPLLVGVGLDDGPNLWVGRLVCWMRLVLVISVPLKETGVSCAFTAVAAETVDDAHMRASIRDY